MALFTRFQEAFEENCKATGAADFILTKQTERAARHRRFGNSPFMVEPNIKEGRGGLRDLQTLYWIARYVYGTSTMGELAEVGGSCRSRKRDTPNGPGNFCGPSVFTFTMSRHAPRNG